MNAETRLQLAVLAVLGSLLSDGDLAFGDWWERPAASWHYKDDWMGLALSGGRSRRLSGSMSPSSPVGSYSGAIEGIEELFRSKPPEAFRRMADRGADHVRYA